MDLQIENDQKKCIDIVPFLCIPKSLDSILWSVNGSEERLRVWNAENSDILFWAETKLSRFKIKQIYNHTNKALLKAYASIAKQFNLKMLSQDIYAVKKYKALVNFHTDKPLDLDTVCMFWSNTVTSLDQPLMLNYDQRYDPEYVHSLYCLYLKRILPLDYNDEYSGNLKFEKFNPCDLIEECNENPHNGYIDELCTKHNSFVSSERQPHIGIISGVNRSVFDIGNFSTVSTLRSEPDQLPLINILYEGCPRIWLFVPRKSVKLLKKKLVSLQIVLGNLQKSDENALFFHPNLFIANRIPIKYVLQTAGTGVYVQPKVAYQVLDLGPNFSESVNYGYTKWYVAKSVLTGFDLVEPVVDGSIKIIRIENNYKPIKMSKPAYIKTDRSSVCFLCHRGYKRIDIHLRVYHKLIVHVHLFRNKKWLIKYLDLGNPNHSLSEDQLRSEYEKIVLEHINDEKIKKNQRISYINDERRCFHCGKSVQSSRLRTHEMHCDKEYICAKCDKRVNTRLSLVKHIRLCQLCENKPTV